MASKVPVLGELEIQLGEQVIVLNLDDYVPLDDQQLSREFADQAGLFAYVGILQAQAEGEWLDSKRNLDRTFAEEDMAIRKSVAASGNKVTEAGIKSMVEVSVRYQQAVEQELFYRQQHLILKAVVASMDQRAQMLISLGAHLRMEAGQTGMLINNTKAALTAVKSATPF